MAWGTQGNGLTVEGAPHRGARSERAWLESEMGQRHVSHSGNAGRWEADRGKPVAGLLANKDLVATVFQALIAHWGTLMSKPLSWGYLHPGMEKGKPKIPPGPLMSMPRERH